LTRNVVIRNIERAEAGVIAGLGDAGVATVHEAQGRTGLMDPGIRPIQRRARIGGSAITVSSHPGDNLMVQWSRAVHAQGTVKAAAGSVNVPIVCGGAEVAPGDVIVADDDGVVVVRRQDAAAALEAASVRLAAEEEKRKRLATGELGVDFYGLRDLLNELGVEYLDSAEDL
jgi:regulator of RNase E activity RraA